MIRWNNFLFSFFCFILFIQVLDAQNLYDLEHSKKFAEYLYTSGQYKLAAEEYERVVFLAPEDVNAKLKLVRSYKKYGNYHTGAERILSFHDNDVKDFNLAFSKEFVQMNLRMKNYPAITNLVTTNTSLADQFKHNTRVSMLLLEAEWKKANQLIEENEIVTQPMLFQLAEEGSNLHYKRPWVGSLMSVILPGAGKFYAGRWKDGIISFIFVAGSAWQAYRGFYKFGKDSAYGWIFGSVSLGFYTGNIYGSAKAVKQYNNKLDAELQHKAEHIIYSGY